MPMTERDRRLTLRQWTAFLKSGLAREKFGRRLYRHLTLRCGFIAHYDLDGFHTFYFRSGARRTVKFLSQFDARGDCASTELGMTYWLDREDGLGHAMVKIAEPYVEELMEQAMRKQEKTDLRKARILIGRANPDLLRRIEAEFGHLGEPPPGEPTV